jgi:hypothetical protein
MIKKVCHHCEKPFEEGERRIFVPIERPYMNLILHEECKKIVTEDLIGYLSTNLDRCYKLWKDGGK